MLQLSEQYILISRKSEKKNPLHITKDFFKFLNTTMKLYFNVLGKKRKSGSKLYILLRT